LNYQSSIGTDDEWEFWGANVPVYVDGITELLNITYQALDIGETYYDILNLEVIASGKPEPTLPEPPAPYASPRGFGNDITKFLAVQDGSEAEISFEGMFRNINPAIPGAKRGMTK
jgi:glucoamylase